MADSEPGREVARSELRASHEDRDRWSSCCDVPWEVLADPEGGEFCVLSLR